MDPTQSMHKLSLADAANEDEDVEDLFASPESGATTQKHTPNSQTASSAQKHHARSDSRSAAEARETKLRAELDRVREVNKAIENVTASLTKAKDNMTTVHQTVNNASTLLATWTRILSQTEHNQRLILNPSWQGASRDLEDMEGEEMRRLQEAERRAAEEQRRREELERKREEEERRRAAAAAAPASKTGTSRGRGRGSSSGVSGVRGTRASTRAGAGVGRSGSTRGGTAGSGTGSGVGRTTSTRGRGRGVG